MSCYEQVRNCTKNHLIPNKLGDKNDSKRKPPDILCSNALLSIRGPSSAFPQIASPCLAAMKKEY